MAATNYVRAEQFNALSPAVAGQNAVRSSEYDALGVADLTISAPYARTSELDDGVTADAFGVTRSPQLNVLAVYGTGERENITTRAWGFVLDGHSFYVLHLGELGTFVCDLMSGLWAQFITQGMDVWNAEQGLMWQGMIVAGDNQNPTLWNFDPDVQLDDDYKPIVHQATGIFPIRTRDFVTFDLLSIAANLAAPSAPGATLTLTYSDDDGRTYVAADPVFVLDAANHHQDLQWSSLGSTNQPGRIFNITDVGGMVRLSAADLTIRGSKNATPNQGS